jgi:hypothetical protein
MIRSELKYFIGAQVVRWKCRVFVGKTGKCPMVQDFWVGKPIATVQVWVEPELEPARAVGNCVNNLHELALHISCDCTESNPMKCIHIIIANTIITDRGVPLTIQSSVGPATATGLRHTM